MKVQEEIDKVRAELEAFEAQAKAARSIGDGPSAPPGTGASENDSSTPVD